MCLAGVRESTKREGSQVTWTIGALWEEYKCRNPDLKGSLQIIIDLMFILAPMAKLQPEEITSNVVDNIRLTLIQRGRKPGTVKNVLELLRRRIISFGLKKGLILSEQMKVHFEMPRLNNDRTEDLSQDQVASLLYAISVTKHKKSRKYDASRPLYWHAERRDVQS